MILDNKVYIKLLQDKIRDNDYITLKVHGVSMFPTINNGEVIKIRKCDNYSIGDIVCYFLESSDNQFKIVIHRVVFVRKTYVLTKGDNNSFIDPIRIPINNILGIKSD